jgi:hypothetical protein
MTGKLFSLFLNNCVYATSEELLEGKVEAPV